jgi:tetratricopeptide (TPR) repeat protein
MRMSNEELQTLMEKVKADLLEDKPEEEIVQYLLPHVGKSLETDEAIVERLGAIPHPVTARILQRMFDISEGKRLRKMIKRSLYRIKTRGISVEEVPGHPGKSILRPLQTEPPRGYGSPIDSLGQRFLLLVLPHAGRGMTVMESVVSDIRGFVHFLGEEMTRKGYRNFFEEIRRKNPFPLSEMEASYVSFLFMKAYQLTLERKETPPPHYLQLKSEIESVKKEFDRPLIYAMLDADEILRDDRILEKAGELLKTDVFSHWAIEEEEIRPYANAILDAEESKLVLSQIQKQARVQEIYQKALSDLFPEDRRLLYKGRLEEMAYLLFRLERQEEAKMALSVALDLEKPLNPIRPNPFLFQLIAKSIFSLLKEAHEEKQNEPSLIMKP